MLPLILLFVAILFFILSRRARESTGLPPGEVVYSDMGNAHGWGQPERPLFSQRRQLTGKPDYLVREAEGYIPVEVKSARTPAGGPYSAHIYQLAAYCALVTDTYGRRPTHGLIQYADQTLRVDYTPQLESELDNLLDEMRAEVETDPVTRSHNSSARCRSCGFKEQCGESLA
jgi:CRISPR-associated exonuclease Cas4